jgi:hypothetical protein
LATRSHLAQSLLSSAAQVSNLELTSLPEDLQEFVRSNGGVPVRHVLRVGYDQLSVDEVPALPLPPMPSYVLGRRSRRYFPQR